MSLEQLESRQLLTGTPWDGADLAIADFDGDGNLDRLRAGAGGTSPENWIVDSKSSAAAGTVETWKITRGGDVPASVIPLATEVLVGDFNGDGRDDLLSKLGTSNWYLITSRASASPSQYKGEFLVLSNWNAPNATGGWSTPIVGDFNGDGRDDLAAFDATNLADKKWQVSTSTGTSFRPMETWVTQSPIAPVAGSVVAGDFNGDGRDDLLFKKSSTNWALAVSDGSRFNVIDPSGIASTAWTSKLVGDFDGDGADELLGWNSTAGRWETVRYNDHRGMSLHTSWGNHLGSIVTGANLHIGDTNRDQRDDLVVFDTTAQVWKVALSQEIAPGVNSFVHTAAADDGTNNWDLWFNNWDWGPSGTSYKFLNIDAPYQKFLDIFSDVYNNVELELYPGFMKGLTATSQTKSANAWEQAALLVDRLEKAGYSVPDVEIASANIEVPFTVLKSWLGLDSRLSVYLAIKVGLDGNAVALNHAGVDLSANSGAVIDAQLSRVRFRHAWVQAKVPTASGWTSVSLDPSWKFKDLQPGTFIDLPGDASLYPGNRGTFDELGYLASAGDQLPLEYYEDQIAGYLAANSTSASLADVGRGERIVQKEFSAIPAELAAEVEVVGQEETYDNFAAIVINPDTKAELTHRLELSIQRDATEESLRRRFNIGSGAQLVNYKGFTGHTATALTLNDNNVSEYGGGPGTSNVDEAANAISLTDVISKSVPLNYTITPHTALEFEFHTAAVGTYLIGWDSNNAPSDNGDNPNAAKFFTVFDSNAPSEGWYSTYGNSSKVLVPIGQFLGNATSQAMSHLVFAIDGDESAGDWSTCTFQNVKVFESGSELTGTGTTLKITQWGDSFKALLTPMTITKRTLLRFDMNVLQEGQFHGIGLDYDDTAGNGGSSDRLYYLSGTSPSGFDAQLISGGPIHGVGTHTFSIPIGDHVGNIDWLDRLVFVTDGGRVEFGNLSLVEGAETEYTHWTHQIVIPDTPNGQAAHDIRIHYDSTDNGQYEVYKPKLSLNGNHSAEYGSWDGFFHAGESSTITVQHHFPTALATPNSVTALSELVEYQRTANQVHAVALDANQYSAKYIANLQSGLNEQQLDVYRRRTEGGSISEGEVKVSIGALLNYVGSKYWNEFSRGNATIAKLMHTLEFQTTVGSGLITSDSRWLADPNVSHLNLPNVARGIGIDIPHVSIGAVDISGDVTSHALETRQLMSYNASALESAIIEEVVNTKSISTIRGLKEAYAATSSDDHLWVFESRIVGGQRRIYHRGSIGATPDVDEPYSLSGEEITVDEFLALEGLAAHRPKFRESIAEVLRNQNQEFGPATSVITVTLPLKKSVVNNWSGSVYVAEIAYSGGRGGIFAIVPDVGPVTYGGGSGDAVKLANTRVAPGSFFNHPYAGDPVNTANGNMFRDEVDFTFANPIVPLDFARHYDSQNKFDVGLGVGWVHSFTGFVYEEQDPANAGDVDYVWLSGSGERHTFETLEFALPNTLFGDVETSGELTSKRLSIFQDRSGLQYFFEPIANPESFVAAGIDKKIYSRLVAIKDATGHQGVAILYDDTPAVKSVRVKAVHSVSTPSRYLQFVYGADGVEVKRIDGTKAIGTWVYTLETHASYLGKRLTQVEHASPASATTNYLYYQDGPAVRRGLIKTIIEPNRESHTYEYYANGRVFRVTDGAGNQQSFNYNLFRNLTEFTDENGNVETYMHQDNGLLLKQIHNDRSRLEYKWGPQSTGSVVHSEEFLMQSSTDERGVRELFDYYDFFSPTTPSQRPGELRQSTAKDGTVTTFEYTPHDYITSVASMTETPPNGTALQTAEFTYDEYGHILTAEDAAGHITKYEYFDGNAPAYLRGLRKSETLPKGVSSQQLAAGETYEAVPWQVLSSAFRITGDTISVQLRTPASGQQVVADAIRIDRLDKDGVYKRIIDSNATGGDPNFWLGTGGGATIAGGTNAYGGSYAQISGTNPEQAGATWIFRDLEPGIYRISASWQSDPANGIAKYYLHEGLADGFPEATIANVNQSFPPADFRSYQTIFEYDAAGNLTRSVTEGLPSGRRAYDLVGNLVYEEDATGSVMVYSYDALGRLTESNSIDPKRIAFSSGQNGNVQSFNGTGGWDVSPTSYEVLDGGETLYLYNGARKGVALNYNVTANTILEFEFEAVGALGEFQAIGLNHSLNAQSVKNFALAGTLSNVWTDLVEWGFHGQEPDSGSQHYRIPIGQFVAAGNYEYLTFINYDIGQVPAGPMNQGQSYFSNIRVYESKSSTKTIGTTTRNYDESGRLRSTTDALEKRTTYEYNAAGRLVKTTFHDRTFTTHEYDDFGNCIAIVDELGRATRFVYDDRNRLIQTIYADGNSTRTRYDGSGQVISAFDERGTETRFTYDEAGRLLTTISAAGLPEAAELINKYDNRGRRIESVDAEGNITKYFYDDLDRLIQTTVLNTTEESPADTEITPIDVSIRPIHVSTIEYDSNGSIARTATFDPRKFAATDYANLHNNAASLISAPNESENKVQVTRFAYDAFGRITKVTNADGTARSTVYDAAGRVRFTLDELGRKVEQRYDEFGRLERIIQPDPDGPVGQQVSSQTRFVRDAQGNVTQQWEFFGNYEGQSNVEHDERYFYDSRNRRVRTTRNDETNVVSVYDAANQLVGTVDAANNASHTAYDERGRVIRQRAADPDGSGPQFAPVTTHAYDEAGNVLSTKDSRGNSTWFEYDALNRLETSSRYDTLIVDDADGGSSSFSTVGTSITDTSPVNVYGRDGTVIEAAPSAAAATATWTFDALEAGDYYVSLSSFMTTYSSAATVKILNYNVASTPLSSIKGASTIRTIEGEVQVGWDRYAIVENVPAGSTLSVQVSHATGLVADAIRLDRISTTEFGYDNNGNVTSQTDSRGHTSLYVYDELGRQIKSTTPDADGLSTGNLSQITKTIRDGYGNAIEEQHGYLTAPTIEHIARSDTFEYDHRNRLVEKVLNVTADSGSDDNVTTTYEYDAVGNTTLVTDAEGFKTHYRYDAANRLIDEYRDFGEGHTIAVSVPLNADSVDSYGPDGGSIPSGISFPAANSVQLSGDAWKKIDITYTLKHNTVLEFEFASAREAVLQLIGFDSDDEFDGSEYSRFFELAGTLSAPTVLQADFRREELSNGGVRFHIPVGQYLTEAEKMSGVAVSRLVLVNLETRAGLDPADRGTSTFSNIRLYESDEVRTVRTYDTRGNLETIRDASDPRNIKTRYQYDVLGRLTHTHLDDDGSPLIVYQIDYDAVGNVRENRNLTAGTAILHEYDRLGRRTKTTLPDHDANLNTPNALVTTFTYDVAGNLIAEKNGENETTRWLYDAQGDILAEYDGNGDETRYRYDSEGNLTSVIDAEQNVTRYTYDGLNRLNSDHNDFGERSYRYDPSGTLRSIEDRNVVNANPTNNRRVRLFSYDALDRRILEEWKNGFGTNVVHTIGWEYDRLGRVAKQVDSNSSVASLSDDIVDTFVYDGLGRIVEERNYDPETFDSQGDESGLPRVRQAYNYFFQTTSSGNVFFDRVDRTQTLVTSSGATPIAYTQSTYDRLGRLANVTDQDPNPLVGPSVERKYFAFAYEVGTDNLTTIQRRGNHDGVSTWQNTLTSTLAYDKASRLKSITHDVNLGVSATDIAHSYAYDNASRVKQFNTQAETVDFREYTYDDAGQLNSRLNAFGSALENYAYDDNGNRELVTNPQGSNQDYVPGLGNRLASDGTFAFTYDKEGNVLTSTRISTAAANDKVTEYTWDHHNRLTKVTFKNNAGTITQSVTYAYDAQGRRVKRVWDPDGAATVQPDQTETFVYDGDELTMSFTGTGAAAPELEHRYLHGPANQVLVDEVFTEAGESKEVLWQLGDHQGSIRDIVDTENELRKHTEYDSFGRVTNQVWYDWGGYLTTPPDDQAIEQLFGYTGQEGDEATGLQKHGQRWYDPGTARWLSEDPLGFDAGDPNLYRYVGNSPLNHTDPTGTTQAGNPLTNLNLYNGAFTSGTVAPAKPVNSFVATGLKSFFGGLTGAAQSVSSAVGTAIQRTATPFHSAVDTASYFAAANEWLSRDFIADGTTGGGAYRGGKYVRDQGTSIATQLQAFNLYAGQQSQWEGSTRSGLVSFGTALFNQSAIQANVTAAAEAYGRSQERSFANLWNTVKLWDNQLVAQNVVNLVNQGSSIGWAVYGGVGTAIGDNVGVSGVYNAYEGKAFYGSRLAGWDRTLQGGLGSVQLVGTAFGLKAPVTTGARAAYNAGVNGVRSTDISAFTRFHADEVGGIWIPRSSYSVPSAGEALYVGTYSASRQGNLATGLNSTFVPHHIVQDAVSNLSRRQGVTINIPRSVHVNTRTFSRNADLGNNRLNLAADVRQLHNLLQDAGYHRSLVNQQLRTVIDLNRQVGNLR